MSSGSMFLCGVIEGFYGKPWSAKQRKSLFEHMQSMQLNAYMYAPKDDDKHRCDWRQLYTVKEAEKLRSLIQAADAAGITFIYALSPGLDMFYSRECPALRRKLGQVRDLGCRAFALLFDDINPRLRGPDRAAFKTPAEAQCAVTNAVFEYLGRPLPFLFCPTEYCASRARPCVAESPYLATLGSRLLPEIGVLWTGPRVVSKVITAASVQELAQVLRRPPVIWDNLHANDYDHKRLFLGPYCGRGPDLAPLLGGVLTNPNCEFEANYIAMSTLAQWYRGSVSNAASAASSAPVYNPEAALEQAVRDWLPAFTSCGGCAHQQRLPPSTPGAGDAGEAVAVGGQEGAENAANLTAPADDRTPSPDVTSSESSDHDDDDDDDQDACRAPLSADELLMVCHLFYLPYRHGDRAIHLLDEFHWLRVVCAASTADSSAWLERAAAFDREVARLRLVRRKLDLLPNRRLALDLLPYVADVCHVLGLLNAYLHQRKSPPPDSADEGKVSRHRQPQEPQPVSRGGLAAELQRLLPPEAARSLLLHRVFAVRQCSDVDRGALAELAACTEPRAPAHRLLELCAGSCDDGDGDGGTCRQGFVLEDAFGVCAFACVLPCGDTPGGTAVDFLPGRSPLLQFAVSAGRCDLSLEAEARPLRRLLGRCLDALDDAGFACVRCLLPDEEAGATSEAPPRLAEGLCDCLGFCRLSCPEAGRLGWQLLAKPLT